MGRVFYHNIFMKRIFPEFYECLIFDNLFVLSLKNQLLVFMATGIHLAVERLKDLEKSKEHESSRGFGVTSRC